MGFIIYSVFVDGKLIEVHRAEIQSSITLHEDACSHMARPIEFEEFEEFDFSWFRFFDKKWTIQLFLNQLNYKFFFRKVQAFGSIIKKRKQKRKMAFQKLLSEV